MDKWLVGDLVFVKDPAGYYVPETEMCLSSASEAANKFSSCGGYMAVVKTHTIYRVLAVCDLDDDACTELLDSIAKEHAGGEVWILSRFSDLGGLHADR